MKADENVKKYQSVRTRQMTGLVEQKDSHTVATRTRKASILQQMKHEELGQIDKKMSQRLFSFKRRSTKKVDPEKQDREGPDYGHSVNLEKIQLKTPLLILMPDSPIRMVWDIIMLVLVLFYGITIPLAVGFEIDVISKEVDNILNGHFVFDMFLNFRTAYKFRGIIVTDSFQIAWSYLKFWFWIDLIAIVPLDAFFQADETRGLNKIIRLIRIVKLFRVFRVARILKRFEEFSKLNPSLIRLGKIFVLAIFIWHWIACAYWFLSDFENFGFPFFALLFESDISNLTATEKRQLKAYEAYDRDGGNLWVPPPELWCEEVEELLCNQTAFQHYELDHGFNPFSGVQNCFEVNLCPATFSRKYIHSFFWAVMVTTGIGRDIMPVTPLEHIFSTVIIIVGVFMYAFIIGSASNSLANWDSEKAERRQKLESVNQYLRQRNIPLTLQKRIRAFYDYLWSSQSSASSREGLLSDLHDTLWLELHISLNRKLVEQVPMFKIMKETECVIDMIERLRNKIFIPGEYLVLQGEVGSEMYIIVRGTVCVLVQDKKSSQIKQVDTLSDGELVGEAALLYRCRRSASIRAATYCDALILAKSDFDSVLRRYPDFRAAIHQLATRKSVGWERVRAVVRMAKAVSFLGNKYDVELILTTKKTEEGAVFDDSIVVNAEPNEKIKSRRFSLFGRG
eukprot:snap_masked-scaffold_2-processed-gene-3.6-mRNA-1 protein AED:1.00 eAED:1.00 QI:0/-1/0/0/-1/1/1/0/679